jgi:hypothetical protein
MPAQLPNPSQRDNGNPDGERNYCEQADAHPLGGRRTSIPGSRHLPSFAINPVRRVYWFTKHEMKRRTRAYRRPVECGPVALRLAQPRCKKISGALRREYESGGVLPTVAAAPWLAEECSLLHPGSYDTSLATSLFYDNVCIA